MPLGFLSAAIALIAARPAFWTLVIGGAIAFIGLLIRAWASGHIRKNAVLAVSGPYSYTRNPLYFGSFLLGLGFTIAASYEWFSLIFGAIFSAFYLSVYLPVMRAEIGELQRIFGADYERYERAVPLFLPRLTAFRLSDDAKNSPEKFDLSLYMRYREYRAAIGLCAAIAFLILKRTFL